MTFFLFLTDTSGQVDTLKNKNDTLSGRFYLLQNVKRDGVTLPEVEIKEVTVVARPTAGQRAEYRRNERLIYNVKRVYPYALMVRMRLNRVNEDLKAITGEKERKIYIKNL
jgi:hypothetical protein